MMSRYSVADIEAFFWEDYPAQYAIADDRFGLFVGDREAAVFGIAFALDATVSMVQAAVAAQCNLLITHHPPFWQAPQRFLAAASAASADGAVIFQAAQAGVALLSLHTNVDCSAPAAAYLLDALGYTQEAVLKPHGQSADGEAIGLGQLARVGKGQASTDIIPTLGQLAKRCRQAFGGYPRVWGSCDRPVQRLAFCSGAGSEIVPEVIAACPDCYITGELHHHESLYLADEGIALIELGHDRSELPYRQLLAQSLRTRGVDRELPLVILEPTTEWWVPGA